MHKHCFQRRKMLSCLSHLNYRCFFLNWWLVWLRPIFDTDLQWGSYSVTRSVTVIRVCKVIDRNRLLTQDEDSASFDLVRGHSSSALRAGDTALFPALDVNFPDLQVPTKISSCQLSDPNRSSRSPLPLISGSFLLH